MINATLRSIAKHLGIELQRYDKRRNRYKLLYSKYQAFTMIPESIFIQNLELCEKFISIDGDIVECGVWRGGMLAAMGDIYGNNKVLHAFDSFEGLPPVKIIDGEEAISWQADTLSPYYFENCTAEESYLHEAMKLAGRDNYKVYKGWFEDTLNEYAGKEIAFLRLDGDWYDSTLACLRKLFPKVVEGGIVIIDDYYTWDGCSRAVHDYLSEIQSPSRLYQYNHQVAYILKKK